MIGKFFADLWTNFKTDKLASLIGIGAGLAVYVLDFTTGWVTANLGSQWYAVLITAILGFVGAWVNRYKAPTVP